MGNMIDPTVGYASDAGWAFCRLVERARPPEPCAFPRPPVAVACEPCDAPSARTMGVYAEPGEADPGERLGAGLERLGLLRASRLSLLTGGGGERFARSGKREKPAAGGPATGRAGSKDTGKPCSMHCQLNFKLRSSASNARRRLARQGTPHTLPARRTIRGGSCRPLQIKSVA